MSSVFVNSLMWQFLFECSGDHRDLHVLTHSFPTRRSSDLVWLLHALRGDGADREIAGPFRNDGEVLVVTTLRLRPLLCVEAGRLVLLDQGIDGAGLGALRRGRRRSEHRFALAPGVELGVARSEEHTSELQSLMRISYAVFCLKNKKKTQLS